MQLGGGMRWGVAVCWPSFGSSSAFSLNLTVLHKKNLFSKMVKYKGKVFFLCPIVSHAKVNFSFSSGETLGTVIHVMYAVADSDNK